MYSVLIAMAICLPNFGAQASSIQQFSIPAATGPNSASKSHHPQAELVTNFIWSGPNGLRRNKRDIEDRIILASRRASLMSRPKGSDEEFEVDDGNEDAWVHDGVDDIHIDPETKKAASELSQDEATTIDAEYEPRDGSGGGQDGGQDGEAPPIANRTRTTTIQEVIPVNTDEIDSQRGHRVQMMGAADSSRAAGPLLPAAYLTLSQVQQLMEAQRRGDDDDDEERPTNSEESRILVSIRPSRY